MSATPHVWKIDLELRREAFSSRNAARAAALWRVLQEVALQGAARAGWPLHRCREHGSAFVVRSATAVHHREIAYGEPVRGITWISELRRGVLITRQVDLVGREGPVISATQQWAHLDLALSPARAPDDLALALTPAHGRASVRLPPCQPAGEEDEPLVGPPLCFECWHTWMDPLGHVNHPDYVQWCDEATSRALAEAGADPEALQPVAEWVKWRRGVRAGQRVVLTSRRRGLTAAGDVVFEHRVEDDRGELFARASTVRRLRGSDGAALRGLWTS